MRSAGYTDVERGERGSTEEHLTVTQFKVQREQERLDTLTTQADQQAQSLAKTSQALSQKEKELASIQKKTMSPHGVGAAPWALWDSGSGMLFARGIRG